MPCHVRIHIQWMNHAFKALLRLPIHYSGGNCLYKVKKIGK